MLSDFFNDGHSSSVVDVPAIFDSSIPDLIAELVALGVLVSIGSTRDRGAVAITVTHDGRWRREYFRAAADAIDWLRLAVDAVGRSGTGGMVNDRPVTQKPTRGPRTPARGSQTR